MSALRQLLLKLNAGVALNGDDIIALVLLLAMVASLAHVITMVITRWGERNVALKSMLASVLIHMVCILGLEVFDPLAARNAVAGDAPVQPQDFEAEVLVVSDDNVQMNRAGNVPLADQPVPPEIELMRFPDPSPEFRPMEVPEPDPLPVDPLGANARDVAQNEYRDVMEAALPVDSGPQGPLQAAVTDPAADVEAQDDPTPADQLTLDTQRTLPRDGVPERELPDLPDTSASGAAELLNINTTPADITLNTLNSDDSDAILLPPADTFSEAQPRRRSAPVAALSDPTATGLNEDSTQSQPRPADAFRSRLPTLRRDRMTRDSPLRNALPDALSARTPIPLSSDYDNVRIGTLASDLSSDITSGGPVVEADLPLIRRRENPPITYQLRNVDARREAAARFGGTQESETAVELSLKWLAERQTAAGYWDASEFGSGLVKTDEQGVDRDYAGRDADTGITALVTLSFLGAGYTHEQGTYALEVDRALDWLIRQQGSDGNLSGQAGHYARMYCHAMATYALAEAYGMQKQTLLGPIIDPELIMAGLSSAGDVHSLTAATASGLPLLSYPFYDPLNAMLAHRTALSLRRVDDLRLRQALSRAVTFTLTQQDAVSGGWRYRQGQEGDVSMFGWQMMSLKSAEIAGVTIDPRVRRRMRSFLNSVKQGRYGGLYGYRRNILQGGRSSEPVTPVMTAEALFCHQMLGYSPESDSSRESVGYLLRNMPRQADLNYYYWYYGTLAMYQYGGQPWERWNSVVRDSLIELQRQDGDLAGSWDPNDPWGRYGGRLYSTALATLTLEVYYRLLPLYRINEAASE
jgi:hypothetical protein